MQKIYIETSVVSYLTARPSKNIIIAGHQIVTKYFWDKLDISNTFISELVLQEASQGDAQASQIRLEAIEQLKKLEIDEECKTLAKILLKKKLYLINSLNMPCISPLHQFIIWMRLLLGILNT